MSRYESSIVAFVKADSLNNPNLTNPDYRKAYDILIDYYQSKDSPEKALLYYGKAKRIDSVMKKNYQFIDSKIIEYVQTPTLLDIKNNEIQNLQNQNSRITNRSWWVFVGILFLMLIFIRFYYKRQTAFKKRFKKIESELIYNTKNLNKGSSQEISTIVVEEILRKLNLFEKNKNYLSSETSLQKTAKDFQTNANYLSRVINLKIGKNFSQYINDLRLEYAIKELLSQSKYQRFTIKAIAEECGYRNADSFSRAFYKKYGLYPSYYIKRIGKSN